MFFARIIQYCFSESSSATTSPADTYATSQYELQDFENLVSGLDFILDTIRSRIVAKRNRSLPVNRLPAEILGIIFSICARSESAQTHWRMVIIMSHICSQWRAVSINFPALWGTSMELTGMSLPMAKLFFERAGTLPVKILRSNSLVDMDVLTQVVFNNFHRVASLCMAVGEDDVSQKLIASDPPLIGTELDRVVFQLVKRGKRSSSAPVPIVMPSRLFGSSAPNIRHMKLDRIRMPWNTGFYVSLSTLKVSNHVAGGRSSQDSSILLALRDCPNLKVLDLHLVYPNRDWHASTDILLRSQPKQHPRKFVSLHTIKLDVPTPYVRHLLSHIKADGLRVLFINMQRPSYDPIDVDLPDINVLDPTLIPSKFLSQLQALRVYGDIDDMHISGTMSDDGMTFDLQGDYNSVKLLNQIARSIRVNYDLPLLKDVEFQVSCDEHRIAGEETSFCVDLVQYPTIESLKISHHYTASAVLSMMRNSLTSMIEQWPQIKRLSFENARFMYEDQRTLLDWCRAHQTLAFLSLSGSSFQADSVEKVTEFIRDAEGLPVEIDWSRCTYKTFTDAGERKVRKLR